MAMKIVDSDWLDENLTAIANLLREKTNTATSITFPEGFINVINKLGGGMSEFINDELTELTIPSTTITLRKNIFQNLSNLQQLSFDPNGALETIEDYAFANTGIVNTILSKNITSIANNVFSGCNNLETISVYWSEGDVEGAPWGAPNATIIYNHWDTDIALTSSLISNYNIIKDDGSVDLREYIDIDGVVCRITSIDNKAFYQNEQITNIYVPNWIESIGEYSFYQCTNLTQVTFETQSQCLSFGNYAFYGCTSLSTLYIPTNTTFIGSLAFYNIPTIWYDGILTGAPWGAKEFKNSYTLTAELVEELKIVNSDGIANIPAEYTKDNITYPIKIIGTGAFSNRTDIKEVYIEYGVEQIGDKVDSGTPYFSQNAPFFGCSSLTKIEIPSSVIRIDSYSFADCIGLVNIIIPNSVVTMYRGLFFGCSALTNIQLPEQLTTLPPVTFACCYGLKEITLPDAIEVIDGENFAGCSKLQKVNYPANLHTIKNKAFNGCTSLDTTIPDTVTTIETDAFLNVAHITYNGTAEGAPWGALAMN